MLPQLEAQRELSSITAMSAAFGGMKRSERQRYLGKLSRLAQGGGEAVPPSPQALGAMGIAVVVVPPEAVDG